MSDHLYVPSMFSLSSFLIYIEFLLNVHQLNFGDKIYNNYSYQDITDRSNIKTHRFVILLVVEPQGMCKHPYWECMANIPKSGKGRDGNARR